MRKKILFIGGSRNQTSMMHQIASACSEHDAFFSPFYTDTFIRPLVERGFCDWNVLGGPMRQATERYLRDHRLPVDAGGVRHDYDLVVIGTDILLPLNIQDKPIVLVQEGMTDPENFLYHLVTKLKLPRLLVSNTSVMGLSHNYERFCVASDGYREHFVRKGLDPQRLVVTGIPNFDDCARFRRNDFPRRGYVLVATSDTRECGKFVNRKKFFQDCARIAAGREIVFKLHPNENVKRSTKEIRQVLPDAPIYSEGNTDHMIANCDVLITQYSSVVYVGIALGKEVHSYFDLADLHRLCPLQNGGRSAANIAEVCREVIDEIQLGLVKSLRTRWAS